MKRFDEEKQEKVLRDSSASFLPSHHHTISSPPKLLLKTRSSCIICNQTSQSIPFIIYLSLYLNSWKSSKAELGPTTSSYINLTVDSQWDGMDAHQSMTRDRERWLGAYREKWVMWNGNTVEMILTHLNISCFFCHLLGAHLLTRSETTEILRIWGLKHNNQRKVP